MNQDRYKGIHNPGIMGGELKLSDLEGLTPELSDFAIRTLDVLYLNIYMLVIKLFTK
jgi:hypothetical protein